MVEKVISKRLIFPKGEQSKFLSDVQQKLSLCNKAVAELIGKNVRTLADWKREKFSMSLDEAEFLSKKSGVVISSGAEIKEAYWYTRAGSLAGGLAVYKKYGRIGGDEEERKKKWNIWWDTKGKFQEHPILNKTKSVKKPNFSSELAEFI